VIWPFVSQADKEMAQKFKNLRSVAVWLHLDRDVVLKATCRCIDEAAAHLLEEYLQGLLKDANPTWKSFIDGPWLSLQMRVGPAALHPAPSK
jgi:hypothetical protein